MKFITIIFIALSLSAISFCQAITYTQATQAAKGYPLQQADLNNDGVSDIVSVALPGNAALPAGIYVTVSNGDGTYKPPVAYLTNKGNLDLALGDFNKDGKVDIAAANGSATVYILLGNGDGTFTAPLTLTPGGAPFSVATADFNRDGNLDLVFIRTDGSVAVANGNGNATFAAARMIATPANGADHVLVGDFDGDGNADIVTGFAHCDSGVGCHTSLYTFYGNGAGGFASPSLISYTREIDFLRAFDANSDGRTDVIGIGNSASGTGAALRILFGSSSRTFAQKEILLARGASAPGGVPNDAADLNGDGQKDLVLVEQDHTSSYLAVLLRNADGSYKPEQFIFQDDNLRTAFVGRYNSADTRPDLLANVSTVFAGLGTNHFLLNTTSGTFPACNVPHASSSIRVCSPAAGGSFTSPVRFNAAGSFTSPLRKVEVWVDGTKRGETFNVFSGFGFLDKPVSLSAGQHAATIFEVSFDGLKRSTKVPFAVK